ncbi:DsbA family protein [Fodinicurvata fenggangensis]|uniref:DsbA family protein n=1 Tax=Fodinicurvata fenggangensis TaxID=1121830 RepID=UPI0009DFFAC2|nr:DsbA family protein [Fodinicurvata fenggangensis]
MERVVENYIMENPEIILRALEVLETRQQEEASQARRQAVEEYGDALFESDTAPVLGNPDGKLSLVEFFDYQCGYCKQASPGLQQLLERNDEVRLVMMEFPILGEASMTAARAALAAREQDRYEELHWALMSHRGQLDESTIMNIADEAGLDRDRLRADMESARIDEELRNNYRLAENLSINSTPTFVTPSAVIPGALPPDRLEALLEEQDD